MIDLDDYDYTLPPEAIAQVPCEPRDAARLYGLAADGSTRHGHVRDLALLLEPGDLVVRNVTRVVPARLRGKKASGGEAEALVLEPVAEGTVRALVRCSGRLREGLELVFERAGERNTAHVVEVDEGGVARLRFTAPLALDRLGEMPLPPYIARKDADPDDETRYQTVFAREPGSVAAPTAGLHFTPSLLAALESRGVELADLWLHVGPGTFRPVHESDLRSGSLHPERYALPEETATAISAARKRGGRVVAVGTTTTRVLEHCADAGGGVRAGPGETRLLIAPGHRFRIVDRLLTNFHLPRSSLLLLAAAFVGRERILQAYRDALARGYRFYSYGDAMLLDAAPEVPG